MILDRKREKTIYMYDFFANVCTKMVELFSCNEYCTESPLQIVYLFCDNSAVTTRIDTQKTSQSMQLLDVAFPE